MQHVYRASDWLALPVDQVFAFFCQPKNLPSLMPAWQRARIVASTLVPPPPTAGYAVSGAAGEGSHITLSFRPLPFFPIRVRWLARIDEFEWNRGFCDRQLTGPFRYWRHCHEFDAEERNGIPGTRITDEVRYELPLDSVAHALGAQALLSTLFRFRRVRLRELLLIWVT
jgi:ligand-binding SRPBCC domain-containing protein